MDSINKMFTDEKVLSVRLNEETIKLLNRVADKYAMTPEEYSKQDLFIKVLEDAERKKIVVEGRQPDDIKRIADLEEQLQTASKQLNEAQNQIVEFSETETQLKVGQEEWNAKVEKLVQENSALDVVRKELLDSIDVLQKERDSLKTALTGTTETLNQRIELQPDQYIIELPKYKHDLLEKFMTDRQIAAKMQKDSREKKLMGVILPIDTPDHKINVVNFLWNSIWGAMLGRQYCSFPIPKEKIISFVFNHLNKVS